MGVTGPESSDQMRRVTARWGMRWFPISEPPLTERATHNCSQTRHLCEDLQMVGKAGKGGPRLGLRMASGMSHLFDLPEKPLCLLPASGTGCAAGVH